MCYSEASTTMCKDTFFQLLLKISIAEEKNIYNDCKHIITSNCEHKKMNLFS